MPMKNPPHPGDFIRTEIIEPARLSATSAGAAGDIDVQTLLHSSRGVQWIAGDALPACWSFDRHASEDAQNRALARLRALVAGLDRGFEV